MGPAPLDRAEKPCVICKEVKPLDEFGPDTNRADGRKRQCRPCVAATMRVWNANHQRSVRATKMKRNFGISIEEYEALYQRANGCCEICGVAVPSHLDNDAKKLAAKVAIDHDHTTGRVRGLLCGPCNCSIGYMLDDPTRLRAAADYLERS
jgi:hypothetical protein